MKLPGPDEQAGKSVWLPIDAKFPKEDYERLVDASERGDGEAVDQAAKHLENRVRSQARDIRNNIFHRHTPRILDSFICPRRGSMRKSFDALVWWIPSRRT